MSYFVLAAIVLERPIGSESEWILKSDLAYYSEFLEERIVVPAGFKTDFASIPRFFHRLLPKNGRHDAAAVVHDWLYATAYTDKDTADKVFLEAMKAIGVSAWKRNAMYRAVKWFGFAAWNGHRTATTA
jgi:hypothetical protein